MPSRSAAGVAGKMPFDAGLVRRYMQATSSISSMAEQQPAGRLLMGTWHVILQMLWATLLTEPSQQKWTRPTEKCNRVGAKALPWGLPAARALGLILRK